MRQFTDTQGRAWSISLTIGGVKRVKDLLRVNLLNPLGVGKWRVNGKVRKRPPLVTRLQLDPALLINVIFALIKPQADQRQVSDTEFGEGLGGEAAYAAYEAFMEEWQSFFHGLRRETEAKAISVNAEMVKREDARNVILIDKASETAETITERKRQQAMEKLRRLDPGRSPTAMNSPELPESTPSR